MARDSGKKTVTIGLVAVPQTAPAVLYSLFEIFASVGTVWEELTGKPGCEIRMQPHIVADQSGQVQCAMGAPVMANASFDSAAHYDVTICTDLSLEPNMDPRGKWPQAAEWIRLQYDNGAIVGSVCSGGLLLAETGLLNDRQATTHWGVVPMFHTFYPQMELKPEKVLALAGQEQRIITAGGAASWVELALYLIARFCGQEEAVRASKIFLLGDLSEGQLPFAAMARPRTHSDAIIEKCQTWIAEHYEVANPVARMAEYAGLGARTFKRRFQSATGYTPIEYVQTLRIEEAKQLLEATEMQTDEISTEVGYNDPASFRRLFKRVTGITPARYRQRYRKRATH